MNQSEFLAISRGLLKAREKPCAQASIGFGFASHWPKTWRETFKAIPKRSNCNRVITFDSHSKTPQHLKITDYLNKDMCGSFKANDTNFRDMFLSP